MELALVKFDLKDIKNQRWQTRTYIVFEKVNENYICMLLLGALYFLVCPASG